MKFLVTIKGVFIAHYKSSLDRLGRRLNRGVGWPRDASRPTAGKVKGWNFPFADSLPDTGCYRIECSPFPPELAALNLNADQSARAKVDPGPHTQRIRTACSHVLEANRKGEIHISKHSGGKIPGA